MADQYSEGKRLFEENLSELLKDHKNKYVTFINGSKFVFDTEDQLVEYVAMSYGNLTNQNETPLQYPVF